MKRRGVSNKRKLSFVLLGRCLVRVELTCTERCVCGSMAAAPSLSDSVSCSHGGAGGRHDGSYEERTCKTGVPLVRIHLNNNESGRLI